MFKVIVNCAKLETSGTVAPQISPYLTQQTYTNAQSDNMADDFTTFDEYVTSFI
jgi:hypothetical protein